MRFFRRAGRSGGRVPVAGEALQPGAQLKIFLDNMVDEPGAQQREERPAGVVVEGVERGSLDRLGEDAAGEVLQLPLEFFVRAVMFAEVG